VFDLVEKFENTVANWFGAPYGVATDSCTHAIELCLRLKNIQTTACPKHTYLSVPMTFKKLGIKWLWTDEQWEDYYQLGNTNIIDAAVLWQQDSYIPRTLMCLSFQYKKHLSLGRGGMILVDNVEDYQQLIKMSYDGRDRSVPWGEQDIATIGYHYYMTPETAVTGLAKFDQLAGVAPKKWNYQDYPNLSNMQVFR
jgi:dTDP-4-amino-4,6-dideoxygalactose transaminase